MDRFDVERSYVMKKYLSTKGVLIPTNIPEKAYITSGTFHHSDTSDNLTLCYPSPVEHSCQHPDFGCHVTSRNQGTFSREEERGPWVRGCRSSRHFVTYLIHPFLLAISYPESTGFLVSGRAPVETLG